MTAQGRDGRRGNVDEAMEAGRILAMHVLQSDLYRQSEDARIAADYFIDYWRARGLDPAPPVADGQKGEDHD